MSRALAWIGAAVSVALIVLCVIGLAGCRGTDRPGCPAGQHAVPAAGGFKCERY